MNLLQLQYFAAVVEEGTISAAARRLHISQPPLSIQIRSLEQEYGVKLLERGARHVRVTEAGKLLYGYAVKMLEMQRAAEDDLESLRAGLKAGIRVGIVSSGYCPEVLDGMTAFVRLHPAVSYRIFDGNTYELLEALEKRQIELAVVRTPYQEAEVDAVTLREDPFSAAGLPKFLNGPAKHAAARKFPGDTGASGPEAAFVPAVRAAAAPGEAVYLRDLASVPLILYRRWSDFIRTEFLKENIHPQIVCMDDDARTSLQWAAAGLGVAIVPDSALPLMPALVSVPLAEAAFRSEVRLIRRRGLVLSDSAEELFTYTKKRAEG